MRHIDTIFIDGQFVAPHGEEEFDLFNPATEALIGRVRLADSVDADAAVKAAHRAFPAFSNTSRAERIAMLQRLSQAVEARATELAAVATEEYGYPKTVAEGFVAPYLSTIFTDMAKALEAFQFERRAGTSQVLMMPLGVTAAIIPWNADHIFICTKLATAIAAGCTIVIKPSEMSAIQTQVLTECIADADLPKGVVNIVTGLGATVGAALSSHPLVAKVSFTGSTATGRAILQAAAETFKRTTLELGGKSPTVLLDDADLDQAIPTALQNGFMNSGQACVAGTRLLVPASRLAEVESKLKDLVPTFKAGDPLQSDTVIGPLVSQRQYDRVQGYIRLGLEEGATILVGGPGRPEGIERGWFIRPTVFTGVTNDMRIAREEIFGPVLSLITYETEEEAIAIANDTDYGLHAYVLGADMDRARRVAARLEAGRVAINAAPHDPLAPFGGFKQSGIGRENGEFGISALLEPKAILA